MAFRAGPPACVVAHDGRTDWRSFPLCGTYGGPVTRQPSFAVLTAVSLGLAAVAGLGVGALRPNAAASTPEPTTSPSRPASSPTPKAPRRAIALEGSTSRAAAGERIDLSGHADGAGVALTVQERDNGAWVDFPAHGMTRSDGTFASYVLFGRSGTHVLRMVAPSTGAVSNPVTVTVG